MLRVIARPFIGHWRIRTNFKSKRLFLKPGQNEMNHLVDAGLESIAIGKIADIFADEGVSDSIRKKPKMDV